MITCETPLFFYSRSPCFETVRKSAIVSKGKSNTQTIDEINLQECGEERARRIFSNMKRKE